MAASGYDGNRARFSGFAEIYDRYRLRPPPALADLLCRYAGVERPDFVVDLGCATGPSTRFWADRAGRVVGVDPVEEMLATARAVTRAENVEYRRGYGHETRLPDGCADIVTCSQSFHWMEPVSTLAEVVRISRPGGVFAAYCYRTPFVTGIEALDAAVEAAFDRLDALEREHKLKKETRFFPKAGYTKALRDSAAFAFVKGITLHETDTTSAERLVGGMETFGALQSLRKLGLDDDELGLTTLRAVAAEHLGETTAPIHVSYDVSIGILPPASDPASVGS